MDACVLRDKGRNCCDIQGSSLFGEDAFYRDAFYDCEEGDRSDDVLFARAREQARLKMRKASMLSNYYAWELKQKANMQPVTSALKLCGQPRDGSKDTDCVRISSHKSASVSWLGTTIPQVPGIPEVLDGPCWSLGHGEDFKVRGGPNYRKTGHKVDSDSIGAMYTALSCDAIKDKSKIENIITSLLNGRIPQSPSPTDGGEFAGGGSLQWTKSCPLPRVICINMMMPYSTFGRDPGCSFVGFFHITAETIKAVQGDNPPPHVKLFKDFWEGPGGAPGASADDPNRSLNARVKAGKKDQQAGLFKAIAKCVNPQDVSVPEKCHVYNGKPCLITKCGYITKDPAGEWMEIGIDVRGFNILARKMLGSFRHLLPKTKIHYGFLIQGIEDDEMPEGLLCDMYVHGINMLDDPYDISESARSSTAA